MRGSDACDFKICLKILMEKLPAMKQLEACLLLLVLFALLACQEKEKNTSMAGESYRSLATNGAWCWFSDPRALYYAGKFRRTYAGWIDSFGNITVGFYDHDLDTVVSAVVAQNVEVDDHDNPSLLINRDGTITVFFSKHASHDPIVMVHSSRPEDISEWEEPQKLVLNDTLAYRGYSDTYTYTNICRLEDENDKLYLFWRGADFKPNYSVSTDGGASWSPGKILILPERLYRDRRPYLKVSSNQKNTIHLAFTDGHPRVEPHNSIYYAKYRNGNLFGADDEKIADWSTMPIEQRQADVVYDADASGVKAWIWDVAEGRDGNPVIVYSKFPNDSSHIYCYAIFHEGTWNNYELINSGKWFPQTPGGQNEREPNYSGGIVLDHNDPSQVYLSVMRDGIFEIEKWSAKDFGRNWNHKQVTAHSSSDNVRPFVVRDYSEKDTLRLLWLRIDKYIHYTDYQSSIRMNLK